MNKHELFLPKLFDLYDRNEIQIPPRIHLSWAILLEKSSCHQFWKIHSADSADLADSAEQNFKNCRL